jgi:hypothetical protein
MRSSVPRKINLFSCMLLLATCLPVPGGDPITPSSGTYKDALRKAGEAGKPVILELYHRSYVDCQRQHDQMAEIPETMKKFVIYRVDGEQNAALAR